METQTRLSKNAVTGTFSRHVSSGKVEFFDEAGINFIIGRREGVRVWDLDGRELINCHSNGGVFNLGHRNPRIMAVLMSTRASIVSVPRRTLLVCWAVNSAR